MIYTEDGAILRWKVPNNHESFLKVQEIFPAIKAKLHTIEPELFFTNIAPSDGRWYQATGSYKLKSVEGLCQRQKVLPPFFYITKLCQ